MISATRNEALDRLLNFVPHAGRDYERTRNEDRGPEDRSNVSTLAPYIRTRLISDEELIRGILTRHRPLAAEKFIQEVFWRSYWKGWLEARPIVWRHYWAGLEAANAALERDREFSSAHAAAVEGRTGNPAFDAWAKELVETGYLHNHARMWFASIWIFTLRLPWELGADFFMRHLFCGDPASNTLSWRWVAGLQTRGKTYLATRENILRYTNGRLDPGTGLATEAEPLTGPAYAPGPIPDLLADHGNDEPAILLLHDDDVGVETLPLAAYDIRATMGFCAASRRSPHGVVPSVLEFARTAISDGLSRSLKSDPDEILDAHDPRTFETIIARARDHDVNRVITPYAPVGPVADAIVALRERLTKEGMTLGYVGRRFDAAVWPHATRGFFALKDKIPSVMSTLGITSSLLR